MRWFWMFASAAATCTGGALLVIAACSTPPETNFGNPNALRRDNLPGDGGSEPLDCKDATPGADGGCGVSFAKDIFPKMKAEGPWQCGNVDKCHGGTKAAPPINTSTPTDVIASLSGYLITGAVQPYINPDGGGDPSKSMIECNLRNQCGQGMPESPGVAPTTDEICAIDAWLRCGAPNN
jgi:hypothetical protein